MMLTIENGGTLRVNNYDNVDWVADIPAGVAWNCICELVREFSVFFFPSPSPIWAQLFILNQCYALKIGRSMYQSIINYDNL